MHWYILHAMYKCDGWFGMLNRCAVLVQGAGNHASSNCIQPHPVTKWHERSPGAAGCCRAAGSFRGTLQADARRASSIESGGPGAALWNVWNMFERCKCSFCFMFALLSHRLKKQKGTGMREIERWIVIIECSPNPPIFTFHIVVSRSAIQE